MEDFSKKHDYNLEGYSKPAHFFVPAAFESVRFMTKFVHIKDELKLMKTNALIDSVYGNVTMIWNGGRNVTNLYFDRANLEQIHASYAEAGVIVRFVCTNGSLTEYDLHDRYANLVMDVFGDVPFEIVVKDERLEDYLRGKYKNAQFISSTTKCMRDMDSIIAELKKDYKYVCLDYNYLRDEEMLNAIPMELRGKVELLINERCAANCKVRALHYKKISEAQHTFQNANDAIDFCPAERNEELRNGNYFYNHQLEHFLELGYNHFKLAGRHRNTPYLAAEIMPYLISPKSYMYYIANIDEGYNNFMHI